MGIDRKLHLHSIVPASEVSDRVKTWVEQFKISLVIMGDSTTSKTWKTQLHQAQPHLRIVTIDERFSSQEARLLYWQMYPPQGILAWLPPGLRLPPRPLDDIAAIILIERYLSRLIS